MLALLALAAVLQGGVPQAAAEEPTTAPDLARALAYRDLAPVREWLSTLPDGPATSRAWQARIELARIEHPERVADLIERARAEHPGDAGLVLQQAALALAELDGDDGRFERLREARAVGRLLDEALELDADHPEALAAAIGFHRDVPRIAGGRDQRIPVLVERLASVDPARAAHVRHETARAEDRLEDALEWITEAVRLDPLVRPGWRARWAALRAETGRRGEAIADLEALVAEVPGHALAWYELGRQIALAEGDAARGIEAIEHYLLMPAWPGDPSVAEALLHLATLKGRVGDTEGARRAIDQARTLDPGLFGDGES